MHDGKIELCRDIAHLLLLHIEQRADLRHVRAAQVCHGLEAADAALKEKIHQKCLDRVVVVVAERDRFDAVLVHRGRKRTAAELGAQRAGIFLLALQKHDLIDRHVHADVLDTERRAIVGHGIKAHARHTRFDRDGHDLERLLVEFGKARERGERDERVLAAGDADGNGLAGFDHVIVRDAAAHEAQDFLHRYSSLRKIKEFRFCDLRN